MATDNKGVMVYLPKELEEYIAEFCTEYSITRKDKEGNILPSLGTGIVTYLKSKMSGESPSDVLAKPKSQGTGLTRDEVLDLIGEYFTSHSPSNGLSKDEVIDLVNSELLSASPLEELRAELSEVSEFARNLQGEIAALKRANSRVGSDAIAKLSPPTKSTSEALDLNTATDASWGLFHQALGLEASNSKKSAELGAIAIARAAEMGFVGWKYNGNKQRFYRQ